MATIDRSGISGAEITIQGMDPRKLREVAPAVNRKLSRNLRRIAQGVAAAAAATVHSKTGETAESYEVQARGGGVRIVNRTASAAIIEFAVLPHSLQGASLIKTLNEQYGAPGRILWAAWDARANQVENETRLAVAEAETELQAILDAETPA